jgi:hypothetical protein
MLFRAGAAPNWYARSTPDLEAPMPNVYLDVDGDDDLLRLPEDPLERDLPDPECDGLLEPRPMTTFHAVLTHYIIQNVL